MAHTAACFLLVACSIRQWSKPFLGPKFSILASLELCGKGLKKCSSKLHVCTTCDLN